MHSKSRWIAIVVLALGFAAVDLLLPTALEIVKELGLRYPDAVFVAILYFGIGVFLGQIGLLAILAMPVKGLKINRFLGVQFLLVTLWYTIMLGHKMTGILSVISAIILPHGSAIYHSYFDINAEIAFNLGFLIIAGYYLLSCIFIFLEWVRGWRIGKSDNANAIVDPKKDQFHIRDILWWTSAVGILLALGKGILPASGWLDTFSNDKTNWMAIMFCPTVTIILAPITMRWVLGGKIGTAKMLTLSALAGLIIFFVGFFTVSPLPIPRDIYELMANDNRMLFRHIISKRWMVLFVTSVISLLLGHIAAQFGTLLLFRRWGYRLTTRKQRVTTEPEPSTLSEALSS